MVYGVSKSGNTLNVILQIIAFMNAGYEIVPITQDKDSALRSIIKKKNLDFIEHTDVGGRFTINQPNALVPVYAAALHNRVEKSIEDFVKSINKSAKKILPTVPINKNPARQIALLLFKAELAGYSEIYMPIYSKDLMGIGNLITQLVHESYGKKEKGQTILAMEGPECQHHTNQRFFGGPKNMLGILIGIKNYQHEIKVNIKDLSDVSIKGIGKLGEMNHLKFSDLMYYERQGVYQTAVEKNFPIISIDLERLDGKSVGEFIALIQGVVMYSAFLRGYRWDDQPAVEDSKRKTIQMALK
jgi:glucose-6-phosphate isomerase